MMTDASPNGIFGRGKMEGRAPVPSVMLP